MKALVTLSFMMILILVSDSSFAVETSICAGGDRDETALDAIRVRDNGVVVVGRSLSSMSGDVLHENAGESDAWIVKFDADGVVEWSLLLGGSLEDAATGVAELPGGELFVSGYSYSADGDFPEHYGSVTEADPFLIKLSPDGQVSWLRHFGSTGEDRAVDVIVTDGNRIVVAGSSRPSLIGAELPVPEEDFWLAKFEANGTLLWHDQFGGTGKDVAEHLAYSPDDAYIISGYSDSYSDQPGDAEPVLIKIDRDGAEEWVIDLGTDSSTDLGNTSAFSVRGDGSFWIGYSTSTNANDGVNCNSLGSFILSEISFFGEVLRTECFGGSWNDKVNVVVPGDNNEVWILGTTHSLDGDVDPVSGISGVSQNVWLAHMSEDGALLQTTSYGGSRADRGVALMMGDTDEMIAVMNTNSSDGTVTGQHDDPNDPDATFDAFVLWHSISGGLGVEEKNPGSFTLFPNPAADEVTVAITDTENNDEKVEVFISDLSGRIAMHCQVNNAGRVDVSTLSPGLYSITVADTEHHALMAPQVLMVN